MWNLPKTCPTKDVNCVLYRQFRKKRTEKKMKKKKKSMEIFGLKLNMSIKGFWALGDRINYSRNWLMLIGSKSHMNDMQRWKVWEQFAKGKGHSN